jgi:Fic family protein
MMVSVKKKVKGAQVYYYLEHSIRIGKLVQTREKYLGKKLPKDLPVLKRQFLLEIYKEKWFSKFDKIKEVYSAQRKDMPPSVFEKEASNFVVKFTYDTNRIEGSSLTYRETALLLDKGITPSARPVSDVKEAEAHKKVFLEILVYKKDLSLDMILYFHKMLLDQTKPDIAGKLRTHQVAISGSKFLPPFPAEVYPLLMEFLKWYSSHKGKLHPVELAALVHLKLVTVHPFGDGNGRISRLLMNFVLNKYGYPMLNIPYTKRAGYYNALERSQVRKDDTAFLQWFFRRYLKELESARYSEFIKEQKGILNREKNWKPLDEL